MAAAAEMAIGGKLGVDVDVSRIAVEGDLDATTRLFSESQSRLLLEVDVDDLGALSESLGDAPHAVVGEVTAAAVIRYRADDTKLAELEVGDAEAAWKRPLDVDGTLLEEVN